MSPQCRACHEDHASIRTLRRHWMDEHAGEIETPEEYLGPPDVEQVDFDGEEPDESGHDPEYEVTNLPVRSRKSTLWEFTGDDDG